MSTFLSILPENVSLNLRNNKEVLDDIIIRIIKKCPNLNIVQFNGVIQDIELFREIFRCQNEPHGKYTYLLIMMVN